MITRRPGRQKALLRHCNCSVQSFSLKPYSHSAWKQSPCLYEFLTPPSATQIHFTVLNSTCIYPRSILNKVLPSTMFQVVSSYEDFRIKKFTDISHFIRSTTCPIHSITFGLIAPTMLGTKCHKSWNPSLFKFLVMPFSSLCSHTLNLFSSLTSIWKGRGKFPLCGYRDSK